MDIDGASKVLFDSGVIGAVLVIVLAAFAWTVKTWRSDVAKLEQKLEAERLKREDLITAQTNELRNMAKVSDSVDELRDAIMRFALAGKEQA
jgi:hypothetical protein